MNHGDGLASGAKKASFTTREGRSMTKEEWEAMFEPEKEPEPIPVCSECKLNPCQCPDA